MAGPAIAYASNASSRKFGKGERDLLIASLFAKVLLFPS
jgi:hypothetical protein